MPSDSYEQLAAIVKARREYLGLGQADVQASGGPSTATLRKIENAVEPPYRPQTIRALERILGLAPDAIDRFIETGDPPRVSSEPQAAPLAAASEAELLAELMRREQDRRSG